MPVPRKTCAVLAALWIVSVCVSFRMYPTVETIPFAFASPVFLWPGIVGSINSATITS
jgi:hypothetical protein